MQYFGTTRPVHSMLTYILIQTECFLEFPLKIVFWGLFQNVKKVNQAHQMHSCPLTIFIPLSLLFQPAKAYIHVNMIQLKQFSIRTYCRIVCKLYKLLFQGVFYTFEAERAHCLVVAGVYSSVSYIVRLSNSELSGNIIGHNSKSGATVISELWDL